VNGEFKIVCKHSGKVLEVSKRQKTDEAEIVQNDWRKRNSQKWLIVELGDGTHKIMAKHSGKVFDVCGGAKHKGAEIIQYKWHGGDNQRWYLIPLEDDSFRIVSKHSGMSLDICEGSHENGASLIQYDWHGGDNQRWYIEKLSENTEPVIHDSDQIENSSDEDSVKPDLEACIEQLQTLNSVERKIKDYISLKYDSTSKSVCLGIENAFFEEEISKIQDKILRDTEFNYEEIKWFQFLHIEPNKKEMVIKFRFHKKQWESSFLNKVLIYSKTAWIKAGIHFEVKNNSIVANAYAREEMQESLSNEFNWFVDVVDQVQLTLTSIFESIVNADESTLLATVEGIYNFLTISDITNLSQLLSKFHQWHYSYLISANNFVYHRERLWIYFKIDENKINEFIDEIQEWVTNLAKLPSLIK
jgi:hypothetical protein